ncbi:MAG: molybdopterin-dependent oxidoreductase [Chloroflexota bacterium]
MSSNELSRRTLLAAAAAGTLATAGVRAAAAAEMTVKVGGAVKKPAEYTAADLAAMPQTEVKGAWADSEDGAPFTAKGPSLYDVVMASEPNVGPEMVARMAVVVTGLDGYAGTYSWAELMPDAGAEPVIVALEYNGEPIRVIFNPAWIVSAGDKMSLRSVFALASIDLVDPTGAIEAAATPAA